MTDLSIGLTQAYPSLNDIEPSWADIAVAVAVNGQAPGAGTALLQMADIAAIKWSRKVEVGKKRGASGGRVMARTTGQGDQEASMTLYRSGWRKMLRNLVQAAPTRGNQALISLVSFNVQIQHTPPGEDDIYETVIKGCRFLGDADDMKEGPDPDKLEIDLNPIQVVTLLDGAEIVLL